MRIHIGRKAPKGFVELPGAVHMGKGVWMMRIEPRKTKEPIDQQDKVDGTSPSPNVAPNA